MSSYDTPEGLRANYEALREAEGWTWAQLRDEIAKQVPADDKVLLAWAAAKARGEAADAEATPDAGTAPDAPDAAPKGRSGRKGAVTADGAAADDEIES